MKVFTDYSKALESYSKKPSMVLNGKCPYAKDDKFCGNWCALFYFNKANGNTSAHVILGCKAGEKILYVEEVVGE